MQDSFVALVYVSGRVELELLRRAPVIVATDGSANVLLDACALPAEVVAKVKVVGDFDSVDLARLPAEVEQVRFEDQNFNDFQKAWKILEKTAGKAVLFMDYG